jgi:hypothetical protein
MASHTAIEVVVVVVVPVPAGAVVASGVIVVVLSAAALAQRVRPPVVPQEPTTWLPAIPPSPAILEGKILEDVQVEM